MTSKLLISDAYGNFLALTGALSRCARPRSGCFAAVGCARRDGALVGAGNFRALNADVQVLWHIRQFYNFKLLTYSAHVKRGVINLQAPN